MAAVRDWENRPLQDDAGSDDEFSWFGECSDEDDVGVSAETSPGTKFVSFLLKLMFQSAISATIFCRIMWLAFQAGIKECEPYGLKPGSSSGHYMRKVKRQLGWAKSNEFLYLRVPGQGKHDIERTPQIIATLPAHEQIEEDVEGLEASKILLARRQQQEGGLPQCYYDHPVVKSAAPGELVLPLATYLDAVPYSQTDGVIGFWVINLLDQRHYLCALLRKRIMCNCGCRGWCTLYVYFRMLWWYLNALARGEHPDESVLGPWEATDTLRSKRGGSSLGFKGACLYFKGDWAELGSSVGLPTWKDGLRPCFDCNCYIENMFASQVSMDALTWLVNEEGDYFDACSRCEKVVTIRNIQDVNTIVDVLRYDRRKQGVHGRALVAGLVVNGTQLLANDRLEPSLNLPDIGELENAQYFPIDIIFWRTSEESLARHRNPVFEPELGITPARSVVVDVLHAVFLGILLVWCRCAVWTLLLNGAYGHARENHEYLTIDQNILYYLLIFPR